MPPPPRDPSKLGDVVNYNGEYRAEIYARGLGSLARIRGPRRGSDKKRAFEDLLTIRDAAKEESTRMCALLAMMRTADRLKEGDETAAEGGVEGGVVAVDNEFQARVQYSENGEPREIKGPRQSIEGNAKANLDLIIAAAASMSGRAERFEAMGAEAHRLQECLRAENEASVGGVEPFQNGFRARIRASNDSGTEALLNGPRGVEPFQNGFRARIRAPNDSGTEALLHGPRRSCEHRAKRDLETIVASGSLGVDLSGETELKALPRSGRGEPDVDMTDAFAVDGCPPALAVAEQISAEDAQCMIVESFNERASQLEREEIDAKASYMAALASRGGN